MNTELPYAEYLNEQNPEVTVYFKDGNKMVLQLFPEVAPNTVKNFVNLVEEGFYSKLIFHRIIENFMIQGGGGTKPLQPIKGEFNTNGANNPLKHYRGVISMARTMDPNSATSQFFIMHHQSPHLDGQYAGFGALVEGFDVLDKYATTATDHYDKPLTDITIDKVEIDTKGVRFEQPEYFR